MTAEPATSGAATARRWLLPVVSVSGTFYLYCLFWLAAWTVAVLLLVGLDPVVITSGSMAPRISVGDLVLVEPDPSDLDDGQVVTFRDPMRPERRVTHRIVEVLDGPAYRTRGDANPTADPVPVPPDHVEGVGRLLVPFVGLPVAWFNTGRITELALLVALTVAALSGAGLTAASPATHPTPRRPHPGPGRPATSPALWTNHHAPAPPAMRVAEIVTNRPTAGRAAALAVVVAVVLTAFSWQVVVGAFAGATANADNGFEATTVTPPTNVSASAQCVLLEPEVTVSWVASTSTAADGYVALRATTSGGPYTEVGRVSGAAVTTYTDTTVATNTTYFYVVRTTAGGWISANSNEASVTTPLLCP